MASKKIVQELLVLLKSKGIDVTEKELKSLNATMAKTKETSKSLSKGSNKLKRNLEGVAQRAGSGTKDFARMQQGMGGLVAAYATVAANVFALSSAFLVMRKAADLSSMIKSAEDFSNKFGVSVTRMTKRMQEATGGALSFAEALPSINKAVSSGVGEEQLTKLAVAATKAAQTFGGSATEALSRFISAAQRGRVEIIQTLGIVIKTEQAYKEYAAAVGKTALELTAADRQQAILNATIEESENIFGDVTIDPNPFQQLLVTITDLKDTILTFVTDGLTPMLKLFNQSGAAAAVLIAIIAKSVGGRIFPELVSKIGEARKAGLQSSREATTARISAKKKLDKFLVESTKTQANLSVKSIKKVEKEFRSSLGTRIKAHKDFTTTIFNQEGKLQKNVLTAQRAAVRREISARAKGSGQQKIFAGTSDAELKRLINAFNQLALSMDNTGIAAKALKTTMSQTTTGIQVGMAKATARVAVFRSVLLSTRSAFKTGFAQGFETSQKSIIKGIGLMSRSWGAFVRNLQTKSAAVSLVNFGRAVGKTAAVMSVALSNAVSSLLSIVLILSLAKLAWDKYGDAILGISKSQRIVKDGFKEFQEELKEINKRTAENIVKFETDFPRSLKKLEDGLRFLAGTFGSTSNAITLFRKSLIEALGGISVAEAIEELEKLERKVNEINARRIKASSNASTTGTSQLSGVSELTNITEDAKKMAEEITRLKGVIEEFGKTSFGVFDKTIEQSRKLAEKGGFSNFNENLRKELESALDFKKLNIVNKPGEELSKLLIDAIVDGGFTEFFQESLTKILDPTSLAAFNDALLKATGNATDIMGTQSLTAATAIQNLRELDTNINTFVLGLEKLRAASTPNKEFIGFLLDARNALNELKKSGSGTSISESIGDPTKLKRIRQLLHLIGIDSDNLNIAIAEADRQLKIFSSTVIIDKKLKSDLKAIQADQKANSIRIIKTNVQALDQIKERLRLEREVLATRIDIQKNILQDARLLVRNQAELEAAGLTQQDAKLKVRAAENELTALQNQLGIHLQNLDVERKIQAIVQENIKAIKAANAIELRSLALLKKRSVNSAIHIKLVNRILDIKKQDLKLTRQSIIEQLNSFDINKLTAEQNLNKLMSLEQQLILLEAQTVELKRQEDIQRVRDAEETGQLSIFSKEGMSVAAGFFAEELRNKVRNLKSTFEIIGQGFANTILSTFDTAVDNLLEGGKNFGRVVLEALKAGLRQVIGEALKAAIARSISKIFPQKEEADIAQRQTLIDEIKIQIAEQIRNTAATLRLAKINEQLAANKITIEGKGKEEDSGEVKTGLDKIASDVLTGNNGIIESAKQVGIDIVESVGQVSGILKLINQAKDLLGGISGEGGIGGILGSLFLANGGMVRGGLQNVPKLANGAIASAPSLAVVGEGPNTEAIVPLPNNKAIPVDLKNEGGGDTINIEQHFDFSGANNDTISQLRTEAKGIEERTFNRVFVEINKGGRFAKVSGRR